MIDLRSMGEKSIGRAKRRFQASEARLKEHSARGSPDAHSLKFHFLQVAQDHARGRPTGGIGTPGAPPANCHHTRHVCEPLPVRTASNWGYTGTRRRD